MAVAKEIAPTAAPVAAPPVAGNTAPPLRKLTREEVELEQLTDRYLAGQLQVRQRMELELFCRDNPKFLDEIKLSSRLHAGLKLIEAAGRPEPWNEQKTYPWQTHWFAGVAAALVLAGAIYALVSNSKIGSLTLQVDDARKKLQAMPLMPAGSTREVVLVPAAAPPENPSATLGAGERAEWVDLKFDVSKSDFDLFNLEIERVDQGRVLSLRGLRRNSNGQVVWSMNSSALGPGVYPVTISGLNWRGQPVPAGGATFEVEPVLRR